MPNEIQPKSYEKVINEMKKSKELNIAELAKRTQITYANLNKILDVLQTEGCIMIAKVETFVGKKKITQAVTIKWVRNRKK